MQRPRMPFEIFIFRVASFLLMAIAKTKFYSWCTGPLAKGCELCVKGRKLVLFITGLCGQRCYYCPISEQKYGKDNAFANEWKIDNPDEPVELFKEAELTEARGAGITGGDPLVKVDRCCEYIRLLKNRFGKNFHIHLYTPLKLVTRERLQKLCDAGLDEIRFHPNLDDRSLWPRLELALDFNWVVGVEIPAIPGYEDKTKALIDFAVGKIKFMNLNELELSDTQTSHYKMDRFEAKDNLSYGVKGSKEMAFDTMQYAEKKGIVAHFCTAKLKDAVQMKNRLKLRARHAGLPFDVHTQEGLLVRGCVYLSNLAPGFGQKEKLRHANAGELIKKLKISCEKITGLGIRPSDIVIDDKKYRLLMPPNLVREFASKLKKLDLVPAIVEEYPTVDAIETDVELL